MCTDAVHEAQFTSSKWAYITGKMIIVAWTFRKQLTCAEEVNVGLSRRCGNSESTIAVYQLHICVFLSLSTHGADKYILSFPATV